MTYDPRLFGADCLSCPLYKDHFKPVPGQFQAEPAAALILELPSNSDTYSGRPMSGPSEQKVLKILHDEGLPPSKLNSIYRIACPIKREKGDDDVISKAAKACSKRFEYDCERSKDLPRLYLGKDSTHSLHPWEKAQCNYVIDKARLYIHSPTIIFHAAPKWIEPATRALKRFAEYVGQRYVPLRCEYVVGATEEALDLLQAMDLSEKIAYDIETQGTEPARDPFTAAGISDGQRTVCIPWDTYQNKTHGLILGLDHYGTLGQALKSQYEKLITAPGRTRIGHNGLYDAGGYRARGVPAAMEYDLITAYTTYFPELPMDLESVAAHLVPIELAWKTIYKKGIEGARSLNYEPYNDSPWDVLAIYCARDVFYTWHAARSLVLHAQTVDYPAGDTLRKSADRNMEIAWKSREWGFKIDEAYCQKLERVLEYLIRRHDRSLNKILPRGVKPSSPQQMAKYFYETLGEPVNYKTNSGKAAANALAVQYIAKMGETENGRKVAGILKKRNKLKALQSGMKQFIGQTEIHPSVFPNNQVTGRWSYRSPPMTNLNPIIRKMFVPRPGNWFVFADWRAAEPRMQALLSGEESMLLDVKEGRDSHVSTAVACMGLKREEVKPAQRKTAKVIGLNTAYSSHNPEATAKTLLKNFHKDGIYTVSYAQVLGMLKLYWKARPAFWEAKLKAHEKAKAQGYIEEHVGGRRRFFYGVQPRDTMCFNMTCQGAVASMADRAIQGVAAELREDEGIVLLKHDEIGLEGPDRDRLARILKKHMQQTISYEGREMVFEVSIEYGKRWHVFEHWSEDDKH